MSITPNPDANFTPGRGNYTDLKPFRFWCQKVLPLVYDDSLSYYELLCKVVDYLNKTMEDVETLEGDITSMYTAFEQLQEYVNHYFDSLDVQVEINNKLDDLVEDGTMSTLVEPFLPGVVEDQLPGVTANQLPGVTATQLPGVVANQLPSQVATQAPSVITNWLTTHITQPTTPVIDDTLTVSGAAADAKAAGDKIASVKADLTKIDKRTDTLLGFRIVSANKWNPADAVANKHISDATASYGQLVDATDFTVSGYIAAVKDDVVRWDTSAEEVEAGDILARGMPFRIAEYDASYNCLGVYGNWVTMPYTVVNDDTAFIRLNCPTRPINSVIFGDSSTTQIRYIPYKADFERIIALEEETSRIPDINDLTEFEDRTDTLLGFRIVSANKWNPADAVANKHISDATASYGQLVDATDFTVSGYIAAVKDDVVRWDSSPEEVEAGDLLAIGMPFRIAEYDASYNCLGVYGNWVTMPYTVVNDDTAFIRLNCTTRPINSVIFGDSSTTQIRYIPYKADFERIIALEEETSRIPDIADQTNRISEYFNLPVLTNDDIMSFYSTASLTGNIITVTRNSSGFWDLAGVLPVKPIEIIGAEYAAIAHGVVGSNEYALTICLNSSSNFGKLFLFNIGGSSFQTTPNPVISAEYSNERKIRFTKVSNTVVKVEYNGTTTTLDLSNYTTVGNFTNILYDQIIFGGVLNSDRTIEINNHVTGQNDYWDQKVWFAFGDSITAMGYYIQTVNNELGTVSQKFGHGGSGYAQLANVYTEMIGGDTPDIITLFAGTNDFGHSGTIEAMRNGMETIINGLYQAFPKVTLVIITPLQRNYSGTAENETRGLGPNGQNLYLIDYVEVIREVAESYGIPCLDLYASGGINLQNVTAKTSDGLHITSEYGACVGHMIASFIKNLMPFN